MSSTWNEPSWPWLTAVLILAGGVFDDAFKAPRAAHLPDRFERYLAAVIRPTAAERKRLLHGSPMTKVLDADPSKEVAVFGAVWIDAPAEAYVAAVKDIENFERGGAFVITKRISNPPRLEDFAEMHLPNEDVDDLEDCRVGDCDLKLDQESIEAIRARVDFRKPTAKRDVETVFRERAYEYVTGYRQKGNAGLAAYRDHSRPTFVAAEFTSMIDRMPQLTDFLPDLRRYLLGYPQVTLPDGTDFLYWQETRFGLKPMIRISHLVIHEARNETVVASKMLYANHYFWTALELRVLAPDPARGAGYWFMTVSRSRSDGLSGFVGRLLRGHVRNEAQKGVLAALAATKRRFETTRLQ